MAPDELVVLAPDVLADSLGDYLRAWWKRIRGGESGALPIIIGLIVISIFFEREVERLPDVHQHRQPLRPVDLHHPARTWPSSMPSSSARSTSRSDSWARSERPSPWP